jgi:hypothetical protein
MIWGWFCLSFDLENGKGFGFDEKAPGEVERDVGFV